jgi:hypothetical protein
MSTQRDEIYTCHRKNLTNISRCEGKTTVFSVTHSPYGKYLVLQNHLELQMSKFKVLNINSETA